MLSILIVNIHVGWIKTCSPGQLNLPAYVKKRSTQMCSIFNFGTNERLHCHRVKLVIEVRFHSMVFPLICISHMYVHTAFIKLCMYFNQLLFMCFYGHTVISQVPFGPECDQQFLVVLFKCGGSDMKYNGLDRRMGYVSYKLDPPFHAYERIFCLDWHHPSHILGPPFHSHGRVGGPLWDRWTPPADPRVWGRR